MKIQAIDSKGAMLRGKGYDLKCTDYSVQEGLTNIKIKYLIFYTILQK
jgi:hypothetical protein